ncbi:MAG: hypothetical protein P1U86_05640 [Verrucomicrobiales bacterium]|nr:hypothetical protein [Verrucomicrobiales bacterium]
MKKILRFLRSSWGRISLVQLIWAFVFLGLATYFTWEYVEAVINRTLGVLVNPTAALVYIVAAFALSSICFVASVRSAKRVA